MAKTKNKKKNYESLVVASVLGVIGVALLAASGMNLTGGAIGVLVGKNLATGIIGIALLIASLVLFVRPEKG